MRYQSGTPGGPALELDGDGSARPSPVQALVACLASCAAIDVVEILQKRREPPTALSVRVSYQRAPDHPRRLTRVRLNFEVTAPTEPKHAERAVWLSLSKYCSVAASLDPAIPVEWSVTVRPS